MSDSTLAAWIDGRRLDDPGAPVLTLADRGFLLGDAAFETLRVAAGRVWQSARHLVRLQHALARMKIEATTLPHAGTLDAWCVESGVTEGVMRITVSRGPGGRGLAPSVPGATVAVTVHAAPAPLPPDGVTAFLARPWVHPDSPLAGIKLADRAAAVVQARHGMEGVIVDAGTVLCGLASNVFLVAEGALITPPATGMVRAGVAREIVLQELAPLLHLVVEERRIEVDELAVADELIFTSAVRGSFHARALEDTPGHGYAREVSSRLAQAFANY